jgi:A/G-specific adenine glycosylase
MIWHKCHNKRVLPWKEEKDPYRIWVSEIILQQTRAEQGILYYKRFLSKFSTLKKLANATLDEVYHVWEGLGYYSRARNMHETAKEIVRSYKGIFPSDYSTILSLKGIGPYTAAAISSFAFQLPYAVVDGNVFRVLSRFFGVYEQMDSSKGKKIFSSLAQVCLDVSSPHLYNQAIMDFGATICKPEQPLCEKCPLKSRCYALKNKKIGELPAKKAKKQIKKRYFLFLIFLSNGKVGIEKRMEKDIWKNLYQFPVVEVKEAELFQNPFDGNLSELIKKTNLLKESMVAKQLLTHQLIYGKALVYKYSKAMSNMKNLLWVSPRELKNYPFPRLLHLLMKQEEKIYLQSENNDESKS